MITMLVNVKGEEKELTFDTSKVEALETFVAEQFCGELFFNQRPEAAKEIARKVLERRCELTEGADFDGFTFRNAPNDYPVVIEIVD